MEITGARVLITGGAGGIGQATALDLAGAGARVMAVDRDRPALAELARAAGEKGLAIACRACDVSREAEVEALFQDCRAELGGLDVLVNSAGLAYQAPLVRRGEGGFRKMPLERWQRVMDNNLTCAFLCAREAACLMLEAGGGVIVNFTSIWRAGHAGQSAYSAAKAGLAAVTAAWAAELGRDNIRVAAVSPGYIDTPMTRVIPQEHRERIAAGQIPLGRFGRPEETAEAVRFIIQSDYLTGRVVDLDGGARD